MARYDLKDRVIAITGSTGGLGSALASALRAKGARLALLDLDLEAARRQARQFGDEAVARGWAANVRSFSELQQAMDAAAAHFGGLDVVIANAGIDTMAPMSKLDPPAFDRVIDVNLNGVWRSFKAALPHVEARHGYLLAISSVAAFLHSPLQASYCASKAGVWALCDSIRLELAHLGVGVGSAHPSFFKTALVEDAIADPAGRVLWRGNQSGLFALTAIDTVVAAIVTGIEARADQIVCPRSLSIAAKAPGLVRRPIERLAFNEARIREAIALASPSGWNDPQATARISVDPAS